MQKKSNFSSPQRRKILQKITNQLSFFANACPTFENGFVTRMLCAFLHWCSANMWIDCMVRDFVYLCVWQTLSLVFSFCSTHNLNARHGTEKSTSQKKNNQQQQVSKIKTANTLQQQSALRNNNSNNHNNQHTTAEATHVMSRSLSVYVVYFFFA